MIGQFILFASDFVEFLTASAATSKSRSCSTCSFLNQSGIYCKSSGSQTIAYLKFKIGIELLKRTNGNCSFQRNASILGIVKIFTKQLCAFYRCTLQVNVRIVQCIDDTNWTLHFARVTATFSLRSPPARFSRPKLCNIANALPDGSISSDGRIDDNSARIFALLISNCSVKVTISSLECIRTTNRQNLVKFLMINCKHNSFRSEIVIVFQSTERNATREYCFHVPFLPYRSLPDP